MLLTGAQQASALTDVYVHKGAAVTGSSIVEVAFHLDKTVTECPAGAGRAPYRHNGLPRVVRWPGHHCGTLTANGSVGGRVNGEAITSVGTSRKPLSASHLYKAGGSATNYLGGHGVNVRIGFLAYSC